MPMKKTIILFVLFSSIFVTTNHSHAFLWRDSDEKKLIEAQEKYFHELDNYYNNKFNSNIMNIIKRPTNNLFVDPFDMFDDFFNSSFPSIHTNQRYSTAIDVSEDKKKITVEASIPGYDPDDINLEIDNGILTISGKSEVDNKEEDKDKKYYRRERSFGSFSRQIQLPSNVDEDKIKADHKNGTLTITIPKTDVVETKAKQIEIKKK